MEALALWPADWGVAEISDAGWGTAAKTGSAAPSFAVWPSASHKTLGSSLLIGYLRTALAQV